MTDALQSFQSKIDNRKAVIGIAGLVRPLTAETLVDSDCIVIVTDHDVFDCDLIDTYVSLTVDTRGRIPNGISGLVRA